MPNEQLKFQIPMYWKSDVNGLVSVALCITEVKTVVTNPSEFKIITKDEFKVLVQTGSYHNLTPVCLTSQARKECWTITQLIITKSKTLASLIQNSGMDIISSLETVTQIQAEITTLFTQYNKWLDHRVQTVPDDFMPFEISYDQLMQVT